MTIEEKWEMVRELGPAAAAYEQRIREMIKRGKQFFDDNPEFGTFEINIAQNNDTLIVGTVWDALAAGFIVADARGRRVIEAVCGEPANQKAPTITMLDLALDQIFRDNNARSFSA